MHMQIEYQQPAFVSTVSRLIYDRWFFMEPSDSDSHIKHTIYRAVFFRLLLICLGVEDH